MRSVVGRYFCFLRMHDVTSFTADGWEGSFYPKGLKSANRLT
jgi:hypothetical protein